MNRHHVSGSITLGRKKFVDVLRQNKKKPIPDIKNYIEGRGPDYVILDTLLRFSKFQYNVSTNTYQVSQKSKYYSFFKEYEKILSKHSKGIQGNELLDILVSPPYGFRLGVIPVFIALADLCFKQPVSHYFDSAYVKELDGDHYDLLMKYPKKTAIHYTPISSKQQNFLNRLSKLFNSKDKSIRSVIESLLKWRLSIPESTKLSSDLSQKGRKLLIQIDSSKEPDKLLFNRIPKCFDKVDIQSKTKSKEIENILSQLSYTKQEIDKVYKKLLLSIKNELISFVQFIDQNCLGLTNQTQLIEVDQNRAKLKKLSKNNTVISMKQLPFSFDKKTKIEKNKPNHQSILKKQFIQRVQYTLSQVKDYPFSSNTNRFIGRILNFDPSNYNQYFLETIADVLTGSSPRYWNNKNYSLFCFALKSVKTEIELACEIANPHFRGNSVLAFIDKGEQKKTFLKLGALSDIDKHLIASVEKIKTTLDSFDEIDKRKIILSLLGSIENLTTNKDSNEKSFYKNSNSSIDKQNLTVNTEMDFTEIKNSGEPEINA